MVSRRRDSCVRKLEVLLVLRPGGSSEGGSRGIKEIISKTRPVCIALAAVMGACFRDSA